MVELNIDLGEILDEPEALYSIATTVNIACGGHAGDAASMKRALALAAQHGARVACHPSYPDLGGFGRTARFVDPTKAREAVADQCAQLWALAAELGLKIHSLKPHGALYHDASSDAEYAAALIDGGLRAIPGLTAVVGFPNTALEGIVKARGLAFVPEGFADRRYDDRGFLLPRSQPGAVLSSGEAAAAQALALARTGRVETICVHSDTPNAVAIARAVRHTLTLEGLLQSGR